MQINQEAEFEVVKTQIKKNQKDWIEHFNAKSEKMISAPDIYRVAKEENKSLIESLQKDFKESWEVTSTRIVYNKDNLDAKIIHDADSTVVKSKSIKVKIPYVWGEAKDDAKTEKYLQALFDTKDKLDEIRRVLKRFDKYRKIWLYTPDQSSRALRQVRSVRLYFDVGGFHVDGDDWIDDDVGLSRGVIVPSAKQTARRQIEASLRKLAWELYSLANEKEFS